MFSGKDVDKQNFCNNCDVFVFNLKFLKFIIIIWLSYFFCCTLHLIYTVSMSWYFRYYAQSFSTIVTSSMYSVLLPEGYREWPFTIRKEHLSAAAFSSALSQQPPLLTRLNWIENMKSRPETSDLLSAAASSLTANVQNRTFILFCDFLFYINLFDNCHATILISWFFRREDVNFSLTEII